MAIRKISLLVALSLLAGICSAQGFRGASCLHIPKTTRFKNPAKPITMVRRHNLFSDYSPFKRNSAFAKGNRLERLVLNYRNEHTINVLATRLQPLIVPGGKPQVTFSGHFVSSSKALELEAHRYVKPEFQVSSKQAVRDMLVRAARSEYGYGVIKVYEHPQSATAEPKMSMFVLNPTTFEWMHYPADGITPAISEAGK